MKRQQAIETVAAALLDGMAYEDAEAINSGDGFTIETDASGQNWQRHEGVKLSPAEMTAAFMLAQDPDFGIE